jgi:hypothetical protein
MNRAQTLRPFHPSLESLEGRELPSAAGFVLSFLGGGLMQANSKVTADFNTLTASVNTQKNSPAGANFQALAATTDSNRAQLQTDFTALKNTTQFDTFIAFAAFSQGNLDQIDFFFAFSFLGSLGTANTTINNTPGSVASLGNQTFTFFPTTTVNQSQQAFNFPTLTLM